MKLDKRIWTIPNILTFIRILSVPVYMYFLIAAKDFATGVVNNTYVYIAFGILVGAASTDLFDGYIARHFNQVSDLGKVLDPIADKLMCVSAIIGLTIIGNVHWAFTLLLALKEVSQMAFAGYLLYKKVIIPSRIYGKVAMWFLSIGIAASFFHSIMVDYVFYLDWIITGIGIAIAYFALFAYLKVYIDIAKQKKQEEKAATAATDNNTATEDNNG